MRSWRHLDTSELPALCPPTFLGVLCVNVLAMRFLALAVLGVLLAATASAQSSQSERMRAFAESAGPPDANPHYFPVGVFSDDPDLSEFRARWYAKHLRAMGEESLLNAATNQEFPSYRFLWLRTFHHPIAIELRIRPDGSGQISSIELDGQGGYRPGKMLANEISEISKEQLEQFEELVRASNYWELPTEYHQPMHVNDDGAQWILEGVKNQKYHVVDRWAPTEGKYREACLYLLKLSRLHIDHIY